jgi:pyrimidine operon attenuation protein/uracil phosphoribosyltransferase
MTTALKNRISKLEKQFTQEMPLPVLFYRESIQTFEEAKEQYKNQHGFELSDKAMVIKIVRLTKND